MAKGDRFRKAPLALNRWRIISNWLLGALCLSAVFCAIQWFSFRGIVRDGPDLYWDTDCYSWMYRVGCMLQGHEWLIRFENVDGYPGGHDPHWTLPFGAWCVALAKLTSTYTAGLIASPLLGLLCFLGFAFWCVVRLPRLVAWASLLLYLFQPAFQWTMALGRPDHQSLIHACFVLAVLMDLGFWMKEFESQRDRLNWLRVVVNALALGLGMWTSSMEIIVLVGVQFASTLVIAITMRRKGGWRALGKRALGWLLTIAITVVVLGIEFEFDPKMVRFGDMGESTRRWVGIVVESEPLLFRYGEWTLSKLHGLFGFSFYLLPILVWFFCRNRAVSVPFKISLTTSLAIYVILSFCQIRWTGYTAPLWPIFTALALQSLVEWARARFRFVARTPLGITYGSAILFLFWPCPLNSVHSVLGDATGIQIRPVCEWLRLHSPPNRDMEHFSMRTPQDEGYSVMTQWWQGAHVLYFARRPVVASSFHTNIDAIEDAYRFFVAVNWFEAEAILKKHRCRYVLVEDDRLFVDHAQRVLQDGRVWVTFSKKRTPDGSMVKAFKFTPLFHETMFFRLQVFNGDSLPLRLRYESRERSAYDPNLPRFKVFEYLGDDK